MNSYNLYKPANPYDAKNKIIKTLHSCKTANQLITTLDWIYKTNYIKTKILKHTLAIYKNVVEESLLCITNICISELGRGNIKLTCQELSLYKNKLEKKLFRISELEARARTRLAMENIVSNL